MVSDPSAGKGHDESMQRLEDGLHNIRNEVRGMIGKLTAISHNDAESGATREERVRWSRGERHRYGVFRRSFTCIEGGKFARCGRPRNSEEQVGDRVRALHEEVGPKRQLGESDQDRGANPAVVSTPSETS